MPLFFGWQTTEPSALSILRLQRDSCRLAPPTLHTLARNEPLRLLTVSDSLAVAGRRAKRVPTAGILGGIDCFQSKSPALSGAFYLVAGTSSDLNLRRSQVEVVAGACSNLKLRTQKSRPDGAAGSHDHGSQVEMVAGARNHLNLRLLSTYRRILEQVAMADHRHLFRAAA